MSGPPNLLTLAEAAALANVDPASLRRAVHQQRLAAVKRGRDWHVERAEIERYVRERKTWKQGIMSNPPES